MCSKTRQGKLTVRRKTIATRLRKQLQEVKETLRRRPYRDRQRHRGKTQGISSKIV